APPFPPARSPDAASGSFRLAERYGSHSTTQGSWLGSPRLGPDLCISGEPQERIADSQRADLAARCVTGNGPRAFASRLRAEAGPPARAAWRRPLALF